MVSAEEIRVPIGQQGADKAALEKPKMGMTSDEVQSKFGEPENWTDAVGTPPITIWHYNDFSVYFEYDKVIHTVLKPTATE